MPRAAAAARARLGPGPRPPRAATTRTTTSRAAAAETTATTRRARGRPRRRASPGNPTSRVGVPMAPVGLVGRGRKARSRPRSARARRVRARGGWHLRCGSARARARALQPGRPLLDKTRRAASSLNRRAGHRATPASEGAEAVPRGARGGGGSARRQLARAGRRSAEGARGGRAGSGVVGLCAGGVFLSGPFVAGAAHRPLRARSVHRPCLRVAEILSRNKCAGRECTDIVPGRRAAGRARPARCSTAAVGADQ